MVKSAQPRKKRKAMYRAALHSRGKMVRAHLSRELRVSLKKRSIRVRKGDAVKVMVGKFRGVTGKVLSVSLKPAGITVEGVVVKKIGGKELFLMLNPSNVVITQRAEEKK